VVLSALIGGRAHPVFESDQGPRCLSPVTVAEEMAEHLPGPGCGQLPIAPEGTGGGGLLAQLQARRHLEPDDQAAGASWRRS
jgi:hypothetical protein